MLTALTLHAPGHALVALKTPASMPIHKATIVPRGNTLGMVAYLPEKDQMNLSRAQLLAHIDICMGGRVAEELIFGVGGVTTGAGSDLQQATSTARNMVTKYGMSSTMGPHYYSTEELTNLSSTSREAVEAEVRAMRTCHTCCTCCTCYTCYTCYTHHTCYAHPASCASSTYSAHCTTATPTVPLLLLLHSCPRCVRC